MRTLESNHHEKLSDIAVVTLEKLMKNELEEEMNDDVRVVSMAMDVFVPLRIIYDTFLLLTD